MRINYKQSFLQIRYEFVDTNEILNFSRKWVFSRTYINIFRGKMNCFATEVSRRTEFFTVIGEFRV